jgi:hypothetical protein
MINKFIHNRLTLFILTAIVTILFWKMFFVCVHATAVYSRNNELHRIDKSVKSYMETVTREDIGKSDDPRLSGIIKQSLGELPPVYDFKPLFSGTTVGLILCNNSTQCYKGPITITMLYVKDKQTGKMWRLPEPYQLELQGKR